MSTDELDAFGRKKRYSGVVDVAASGETRRIPPRTNMAVVEEDNGDDDDDDAEDGDDERSGSSECIGTNERRIFVTTKRLFWKKAGVRFRTWGTCACSATSGDTIWTSGDN